MVTQDIKIMEYLLNEGANVNVRESSGNKATALHYAISSKDSLSKVRTLVEAGRTWPYLNFCGKRGDDIPAGQESGVS